MEHKCRVVFDDNNDNDEEFIWRWNYINNIQKGFT